MTLTRWTALLGGFLVLLGLVAYLGTGRQSVTALIPAFLGVPVILCSLWARRESARTVALSVATVLAVVGFAGTVTGIVKTVRLVAGQEIARPVASVAQALVAVACLAYLLMALRTLVRARRVRAALD